jgi:hypothetical protein
MNEIMSFYLLAGKDVCALLNLAKCSFSKRLAFELVKKNGQAYQGCNGRL